MFVEQSGELIAGTLISDGAGGFTPEGDGIDASSVADAEAKLSQVAVQSNSNSQDITEDANPLTPAFGFTADATFNTVAIAAGDDAEIEAGIDDVEVSLEQEQEDIDQDNTAEQEGEAEAYAYSGEVDVEQTGELFAAEDGIDATSRAEASAELEQQAGQDNVNAQSAATSLAFDASPTFGTTAPTATVRADTTGGDANAGTLGGVAVAALDDVEIEAGIEDVEVSVEQDQEDIEQENEADQDGDVDTTAYAGDVTVISGTDEVPVDPAAGDTGIDAASEADADASLEQVADQSNTNSQDATTAGSFSAAATFNTVALAAGAEGDVEIDAGIEDVEAEVDQDQEDIDQSNDADQAGETYATAYSGYVEVEQKLGGTLEAGGTGIEAEF